jgi:hypothetical protein
VLADPGSLYTAGPIAVVVVACLLGLLLRWILGARRSRYPGARSGSVPRPAAPRPAASGSPMAGPAATGPTGVPAEYGLLRQVALLPGRADGDSLRTLLSDAGIRSTLSARPDGQVAVLVFAADVERARTLLPPP